MITSISLGSYRSFGTLQRVPLGPITALVGPNNSGKSVFMSMPAWLRRRMEVSGSTELDVDVLHRPPPPIPDAHRPPDTSVTIGWEWSDLEPRRPKLGRYLARLHGTSSSLSTLSETLEVGGVQAWVSDAGKYSFDRECFGPQTAESSTDPFFGLRKVRMAGAPFLRDVVNPVLDARLVNLSVARIRAPVLNSRAIQLDSDGGGAATVLARWRGFEPDRAARLDRVLNRALPDLTRALVDLDSVNNNVLWFQHDNGEKFDASRVSDGVLFFLALAMHVLDAPPGALIFVEEPENGIHPLLLRQVVDLMRTTVHELGCQIVLATHSPTLLLEFRTEPEAIILFRRKPDGSAVVPLSEAPHLLAALERSDPAELLANGFFNDPL